MNRKPIIKRTESLAGIVEIFDVSDTTFKNWRRRGLPCSKRDGKLWFCAAEVAAWLKDHPSLHLGPGRQQSPESAAMAEAQLRKCNALADMYELNLAKAAGELVFVKEVEQAAAEVAIRVRDRLLQIPAAMAPQLEGLNAQAIEIALDDRIREDLTLLSEQWQTTDAV